MKFKVNIKMNPWTLLLCVAFSESELRVLLYGAGDALAWSLRPAVLAGRLLSLAQKSEALRSSLSERFEAKFSEESKRYRELSALELFERWSCTHQTLRGVALGGLLWSILQRRAALLPSLWQRLAEDIQCLALHALTTPTNRRNDDPRELQTRNPLSAQRLSDQPV